MKILTRCQEKLIALATMLACSQEQVLNGIPLCEATTLAFVSDAPQWKISSFAFKKRQKQNPSASKGAQPLPQM